MAMPLLAFAANSQDGFRGSRKVLRGAYREILGTRKFCLSLRMAAESLPGNCQ